MANYDTEHALNRIFLAHELIAGLLSLGLFVGLLTLGSLYAAPLLITLSAIAFGTATIAWGLRAAALFFSQPLLLKADDIISQAPLLFKFFAYFHTIDVKKVHLDHQHARYKLRGSGVLFLSSLALSITAIVTVFQLGLPFSAPLLALLILSNLNTFSLLALLHMKLTHHQEGYLSGAKEVLADSPWNFLNAYRSTQDIFALLLGLNLLVVGATFTGIPQIILLSIGGIGVLQYGLNSPKLENTFLHTWVKPVIKKTNKHAPLWAPLAICAAITVLMTVNVLSLPLGLVLLAAPTTYLLKSWGINRYWQAKKITLLDQSQLQELKKEIRGYLSTRDRWGNTSKLTPELAQKKAGYEETLSHIRETQITPTETWYLKYNTFLSHPATQLFANLSLMLLVASITSLILLPMPAYTFWTMLSITIASGLVFAVLEGAWRYVDKKCSSFIKDHNDGFETQKALLTDILKEVKKINVDCIKQNVQKAVAKKPVPPLQIIMETVFGRDPCTLDYLHISHINHELPPLVDQFGNTFNGQTALEYIIQGNGRSPLSRAIYATNFPRALENNVLRNQLKRFANPAIASRLGQIIQTTIQAYKGDNLEQHLQEKAFFILLASGVIQPKKDYPTDGRNRFVFPDAPDNHPSFAQGHLYVDHTSKKTVAHTPQSSDTTNLKFRNRVIEDQVAAYYKQVVQARPTPSHKRILTPTRRGIENNQATSHSRQPDLPHSSR